MTCYKLQLCAPALTSPGVEWTAVHYKQSPPPRRNVHRETVPQWLPPG